MESRRGGRRTNGCNEHCRDTTLADHSPHHVAIRNQRFVLICMEALLLGHVLQRPPAEKVREV